MTIEQFVHEIADQMGIDLSEVSVINGDQIGFHGKNLLTIYTKDHLVKSLVNKTDIANLQNNDFCDSLEIKILTAMSQLQVILEE
jgi:hypothetical protein